MSCDDTKKSIKRIFYQKTINKKIISSLILLLSLVSQTMIPIATIYEYKHVTIVVGRVMLNL